MPSKYQQGCRRMLVDMHIPDWDPAFLSKYDPAAMAGLFERAHLTSVMLYCKSHVGLCYWPTKVGKMHSGIHGRDVVGELLGDLRARNIAACAYYSIVFDNWAVETHPDWAERPASGLDISSVIRYGICCQNHPDYRAYEMAQLEDLLSSYQFDALFLDMIFWPVVCGCDHCRRRYRDETGKAIPTVVDWTAPEWCEFQAARERWTFEFTRDLMAKARALAPDIALTHNLSPALANWVLAQPLSASVHDTFVAGDLYGDRIEQLVVSKMTLHLSETRPAEFMTSLSADLSDHASLKSEEQMRAQASAASAMSSAFLFIDAIDPIGTVNPAAYERVGRVFAATERFEPYLGGEPIEDVGVYFSAHSQMDFAENGKAAANFMIPSRTWPHLDSVRGACRALGRAHIPFGVVTRKQLGELGRFRAVILPGISRMDRDEADAMRNYVRAGGRLYASRYTSLVETTGVRHADFMLSDVFGASLEGEEPGAFVYLRPASAEPARWIETQKFVSLRITGDPFLGPAMLCGIPRLRVRPAGVTLFSLAVPYGYPARGSVSDHRWASIHSSPPWEDLDHPMVVLNEYGAGRAVYSAAAIEAVDADAQANLFVAMVRMLLDGEYAYTAEAHPALWMSVFDQREKDRLMASFLNYQAELPPVPVRVRFSLRAPHGKRFRSLRMVPEESALKFALDSDGTLRSEIDSVDLLAMVLAEYE